MTLEDGPAGSFACDLVEQVTTAACDEKITTCVMDFSDVTDTEVLELHRFGLDAVVAEVAY